jgi:hypothetical protein
MMNPFLPALFPALGLSADTRIDVVGDGDLPSAFLVTDLAAASFGVAGAAVAAYANPDAPKPVQIDRRLASFWYQTSFQPRGWELPPTWDSVAGDYRTADGWIRLHTNANAHRAAALSVLNLGADRDAVTKEVATWSAMELESAVVAAGGCAAEMRSPEAWAQHPNGAAVATEPLVHLETLPCDVAAKLVDPQRPLKGVRVLDLTKILAGPMASRFLAAYGADVLRIDAPWWDEPSLLTEVTLGKRCAGLDLRNEDDRSCFKGLIAQCDVMLHGYRADALERLGFGEEERRALNPRMIDVSHNAFGWTGPWKNRRGYDSLVQMSSGIADTGMRCYGRDKPHPLPAQALDHATGYFLAAAVVQGLSRRRADGVATTARLSLSRTARLLVDHMSADSNTTMAPPTLDDTVPEIEKSLWGDIARRRFPVQMPGCAAAWDFPVGELRTSKANFLEAA